MFGVSAQRSYIIIYPKNFVKYFLTNFFNFLFEFFNVKKLSLRVKNDKTIPYPIIFYNIIRRKRSNI